MCAEAAAARLLLQWLGVETIPGTGHHVHIDDRPAFMSAILDWMAGSDHGAGG